MKQNVVLRETIDNNVVCFRFKREYNQKDRHDGCGNYDDRNVSVFLDKKANGKSQS